MTWDTRIVMVKTESLTYGLEAYVIQYWKPKTFWSRAKWVDSPGPRYSGAAGKKVAFIVEKQIQKDGPYLENCFPRVYE